MAGTAALTVSWLLATGRFDPNRSHVNKVQAKVDKVSEIEINSVGRERKVPDYKVPRDLFNSESDKNEKYPEILSTDDFNSLKTEEITDDEIKGIINIIVEGVTEEIPNMKALQRNEVNEESNSVETLEVGQVNISFDTDELTLTNIEDFELSAREPEEAINTNVDDIIETTINPIDSLEITTILN